MVRWNYNLVTAFPTPYLENRPLALPPSVAPKPPFPFFALPNEIRNRIYALVLFTSAPYCKTTCTSLLLASRRLHNEASYILYSSTTFRIFPLQDFTPIPTIRDLPYRYRKLITSVELVLGPSWTAPPKTWKVNKSMARALASMGLVQTLNVFVEVDPSHPIFAKFRVSHGFYTEFCGQLLRDVLKTMPTLKCVQISGRPSVQLDGPLVSRLRQEIEAQGKLLKWGEMGRMVSVEDSAAEIALAMKSAVPKQSTCSVRAPEQVLRKLEEGERCCQLSE